MELHQLRYVLKVAQFLNFSRAAAELCIAQPTLSQQIRKLENELGLSLFERKTRSVKLTSAGEQFVAAGQRVAAELDNLRQQMQDCRSLRTGSLRIGTLTLTGSHGLISGITAFQQLYPGIHIKIIETAGSYELIDMLQSGAIDIACLIPPPQHQFSEQIALHPLVKGHLVLVVAKSHPCARKKKIALADVSQDLFILPPATHSMYQVALDACRKSGFEPRIACECSQLSMVFNLVARGNGISFASSQLLEETLPQNIKLIPLHPPIERSLYLAALKDKHQLSVIAAFRDFMLAETQGWS